MNNKKIILILSIFLSVSIISLLICVFYFINNKKTNSNIINKIEKIEKVEKVENQKTYSDSEYGFMLNYPNNLIYTVEDNQKILLSDDLIKLNKNKETYKITDRVISFRGENNGPWVVNIDINKNTKYKNIEEWFNYYIKNQFNFIKIVKENIIKIDNNKAIITHVASLDEKKEYILEEYPYEKTVAFIKDNNLFFINIKENINSSENYMKFLESFKFIK